MTPPDFIVKCSCGKTARIFWQPSIHAYITLHPSFRAAYPEGWTCGAPGHTQLVPPTPATQQPTRTPTRIKL